MKFLIYANDIDAKARNHEEACRRMWSKWIPQNDHDTPYWWSMKTHPDTGEVALCIPDSDAEELEGVVDSLDPSWEPEVEA